ncbi:asparagine synthase-related protein [Novosphingobium tardum]|uniref:asparagine synthase (glutamine-hydrolyzing) n=1 Tax=Novosphingobium tardum TaxID=1538021 RepID=A0ABV8RK83_9SPHN
MPARSPGGSVVLFHGWLDNRAALADRLGVPRDTAPPVLYGLAVEKLGDDADLAAIGDYCAITADPATGRTRLSRSALNAPPLHYHHDGELLVASSVPRAIFAAGVPMAIDEQKLADSLVGNFREEERSFYQALAQVPIGATVTIGTAPAKARRFYSLANVPPIAPISDEDCIARARELLAEATRCALDGFANPGICLSGGLDSAQIAAEMLRQMPDGQRLPSFTFTPDPDWDREIGDDIMGDERPFVEAFAAQHPSLDPHFFDNAGIGFDERMDDMLLATGVPASGLPNMYHYHALWRAARDAGCDMMVVADFGNQTFSNDARWAYAEFFRRGRWIELYRLLRDRPGDGRSVLRKFLSLCVLNALPMPLHRLVRRIVHGSAPTSRRMTAINPQFAERTHAFERLDSGTHHWDRYAPRTRREEITREFFNGNPESEDVRQGFEQLYNVAWRTIPAYRPLVEFCWSLPTEKFARGGVTRWLARAMAEGVLPDEQRSNLRMGQHSVDWHTRIGRDRQRWSDDLARWEEIPQVAETVDLGRMRRLLNEDWPTRTSWNRDVFLSIALGVPRAIMNGRFVAMVNGRNDR